MQNQLKAVLPLEAPISIVSLHDQAALRIRDLIVTGKLPAGDKINERELCEMLGVSRTPLREALKVLSGQGFTILTPNRGARVARPTGENIAERVQLIIALESYAIRSLCLEQDSKGLEHLETLHAQLLDSVKREDVEGFFAVNAAFHHATVESLGNDNIFELYRLQIAHLRWARLLANKVGEFYGEAAEDHERIMQAIRDKDAVRAQIELEHHRRNLKLELDS